MKDYKEMAESVFARREQYNARRKMVAKRSVAIVACCCVAALLAVGVWHSNLGSTTPPPIAGEQLHNTNVPDKTTRPNTEPDIIDKTVEDIILWLPAEDVLKAGEGDSQMGVAVPMLVAYQGAIYIVADEESTENSRYALSETKILLRKGYAYSAYRIQEVSNRVAIVVNGRLMIYQKLLEVDAVVDGTSYSALHPIYSRTEYTPGEVLLETGDFTVYQAVDTQSGEVLEEECVISILPALKKALPAMFGGDEDYGDAWWVAVPGSDA